ncbi:MAG: formylglycine-generating enzyme family protein [Spirochaetaceae bacterium]|nr:MAG: formylglycine-generating enzyme family protein [Spirochaetaceae bacterium]
MSDPDGCCTPGRHAREHRPAERVDPEILPRTTSGVLRHDTVALPGGTFLMGTDDQEGFADDGEGPIREVTVSPFEIDRYAVTNTQFAHFVDATGYQTEAERYGWSFVFHLFVPKKLLHRRVARRVPGLQWWYGVNGAYWARPEGPGSDVEGRADHPVVHVSWADAVAYAEWSGMRLPTEAEWEYAARGGLVGARYAWGDELTPGGEHRCNIWQGTFPTINTREDGFAGTAPVDSYQPNGYGLCCVAGNVWEWCSDWWSPDFHATAPRADPVGPTDGSARVMKGGSYLCHHSYCNRYRVGARTSNTPDSSTGNLGFRCVRSMEVP